MNPFEKEAIKKPVFYKEFAIQISEGTQRINENIRDEIEEELLRIDGVKDATLAGKNLGIDIEEKADWSTIISNIEKTIKEIINKELILTEKEEGQSLSIQKRKGRREIEFVREEFGNVQ